MACAHARGARLPVAFAGLAGQLRCADAASRGPASIINAPSRSHVFSIHDAPLPRPVAAPKSPPGFSSGAEIESPNSRSRPAREAPRRPRSPPLTGNKWLQMANARGCGSRRRTLGGAVCALLLALASIAAASVLHGEDLSNFQNALACDNTTVLIVRCVFITRAGACEVRRGTTSSNHRQPTHQLTHRPEPATHTALHALLPIQAAHHRRHPGCCGGACQHHGFR